MAQRLLSLVAVAALSVGIVAVPRLAGAQTNMPSFTVFMGPKSLTTHSVAGFFWPLGSTVTMQIRNPSGSVVYTASTTAGADGDWHWISNGLFAAHEGDVVRLSDNATVPDVAETVVQYLTLTTLDPSTDTITGTARPGTKVYIAFEPAPPTLVAEATTNGDGRWSVNLSSSGYHLADQQSGLVQTDQPGGNHIAIPWQVLPTPQRLTILEDYAEANFAHNTGVFHVLTSYVTRARRFLAQQKTSVVCLQTRSLYRPIQAFQRSGAETSQQAWQLTMDVGWVLVALGC